jgi:tRNA U34 5-methylaminomethyl-2-thiouridine-forming methyltransferase MnmC
LAAFKSKDWQCFSAGKVNIKARLLDNDLRQALQKDLCASKAGLIYHDPFAPQKVPILWTTEVFGAYKQILKLAPAALFTYASASAVRGAMLDNGFSVYQTAKLGGKSGGTLATARPLAQSWLEEQAERVTSPICLNSEHERLQTSSRVPYRDAHGTSRSNAPG